MTSKKIEFMNIICGNVENYYQDYNKKHIKDILKLITDITRIYNSCMPGMHTLHKCIIYFNKLMKDLKASSNISESLNVDNMYNIKIKIGEQLNIIENTNFYNIYLNISKMNSLTSQLIIIKDNLNVNVINTIHNLLGFIPIDKWSSITYKLSHTSKTNNIYYNKNETIIMLLNKLINSIQFINNETQNIINLDIIDDYINDFENNLIRYESTDTNIKLIKISIHNNIKNIDNSYIIIKNTIYSIFYELRELIKTVIKINTYLKNI
uniref:Uncharacterized protein n=1 Tax=viral metagenome TaxID=1070528 RepID=A0A6C0H8G0_9ZZZZ